MKLKSKLTHILFALLAVILFTVCISAEMYGDLTYTVSNGEVTITDCNETASGALIIPAEIEGYPVTSIGELAFYECSYLDNITIPSTVTSMGEEEFEEAFIYCSRLMSITVDAANPNYSSDEQGVLYNKDKTTLLCCPGGKSACTIPSSVTTIGFVAFYGCSGLTSIEIPSSVTSIREQAFHYCSSLTSIEIPSSVTGIEAGAFASCYNLTSVTFAEGSQCTGIDLWAFRGCSGLTSIEIPSSVTYIDIEAFAFCGLTSIEIPSSVTQIGGGAFAGCDNLTSITIWNAHCAGIGNDGSFPLPKSAVIYGRSGSSTKEYANECGLAFAVATCAHPATYRDALVEIPATCTEAGSRTYNCLMCGDAVEEIIPASHDYVLTLTAKAPTCTENGVGRYSCTRCGDVKYDDIPKVSALALSGVYTNGEGDLRFVTRVTSTAGDPEIEYFGTYIVPLSYFTANALTTTGAEQVGVGTVKYTQSIENGKTFAADLCNIPTSAYDAPIFAWSFIKFKGVNDICVQTLGSFTVNEATLVKGGF